jgi:hypothetical protein
MDGSTFWYLLGLAIVIDAITGFQGISRIIRAARGKKAE